MNMDVIVTDQELPVDVIRAIEQGKKILAIKLLREATGIGLANAKVLVDRAATRYTEPDHGPNMVEDDSGGARLLKMLLLLTLVFALHHFFFSG